MTVPTAPDLPGLTVIQKMARVAAVVFILVGVLGFVPGVTSDAGNITFASHHSPALLLGLFQVSILHNLVHLLFGVAGLVLSRTIRGARGYLAGGGIVYLLLFVYGLVIPSTSAANFLPVNNADNLLHLGLGLGLVAMSFTRTRRGDPTSV